MSIASTPKISTTSVQFVKGVGPHKKKLFENLGIATIEDMFYLFPRRYEDRRHIVPLNKIKLGEWQTVRGKILIGQARKSWYTKKHVVEVILDDGTGRVYAVWFNQPYQATYLQPGKQIVCFGKVDRYKERLQMVSPEYEFIEDDEQEHLNLNRIVPMYPLTRGITQRFLRKVISGVLHKFQDDLIDELPVALRNKHRLYNIKRSISNIHFPESFEDQEEALRRISFEEFFFFQLSVILRRLSITQKEGIAHQISDSLTLQYVNGFGFELTNAQKKVIREIREDMKKPVPMLRLLQGDVGSGKTLVALFGALAAKENGYQSAIMAPTEILARQHFENVQRLSASGVLKGLKAGLLISSIKPPEKEKLQEQIRKGAIDLVIGTHALITENISFKNLSYAVIDEQHKFGVRQRALLAQKGKNPDVLIMTATPIPRTLCITLYGDLDVSVIDEQPPGRGKIKTQAFGADEEDKVHAIMRAKVKEGRQVYVIYPIIGESETNDLKAAEVMYKNFKDKIFKDCRVGLIHGRLKPKETAEVMEKFKKGETDILVATTVLEVGIDVANATVMVIEHAERFGLSQLHQLRGRIGRGKMDSLCLLIRSPEDEEAPPNEDAERRLKAILSTTDGFKIAQEDLMIRGPGHFFGRHQHGLNELKVANPATQLDILELARQEALELTGADPNLSKPDHQPILQVIRKRYPNYLQMVAAG